MEKVIKELDILFGRTVYPSIKRLKYSNYNKKPKFIKIENTSYCNARCVYCPHKTLKRPQGTMSEKLYKKIIDEVLDWRVGEIHLCNFGEPLIDKRLADRIKYIKLNEKIPTKTVIYTNGSLLSKENSRRLMSAGIDEIYVSFDGYNKNHFEKTRVPLKYDLLVDNIENIIKIRNESNYKTKIILQAVYDGKVISKDKINTFKNKWKNKVDLIHLQPLHNWQGYLDVKGKFYKNIVCTDIFRYMTILWEGSVVPCCLDYEGQVLLGDVNKNSLKEVWLGNKFKNFRKMLLNDITSMKMCEPCMERMCSGRFPYFSSLVW